MTKFDAPRLLAIHHAFPHLLGLRETFFSFSGEGVQDAYDAVIFMENFADLYSWKFVFTPEGKCLRAESLFRHADGLPLAVLEALNGSIELTTAGYADEAVTSAKVNVAESEDEGEMAWQAIGVTLAALEWDEREYAFPHEAGSDGYYKRLWKKICMTGRVKTSFSDFLRRDRGHMLTHPGWNHVVFLKRGGRGTFTAVEPEQIEDIEQVAALGFICNPQVETAAKVDPERKRDRILAALQANAETQQKAFPLPVCVEGGMVEWLRPLRDMPDAVKESACPRDQVDNAYVLMRSSLEDFEGARRYPNTGALLFLAQGYEDAEQQRAPSGLPVTTVDLFYDSLNHLDEEA